MADKEQTKWSGSYSLKYSRDTSYKNKNSAGLQVLLQVRETIYLLQGILTFYFSMYYHSILQILGNQNGYQASRTILDIYNVRYVKIESTGKRNFCLRIEICGEGKTYTAKNEQLVPS